MPLSVTDIARCNGGTGVHATVTVNHEGVARTFTYDLDKVDEILGDLAPLEKLRILVALWVKYRQTEGRALVGVNIA